MTLTRKEHWQTRAYHQFLMERSKTPFQWGVNDCALFAADGIEAQTGVDIASDFRNKYSDEDGAFSVIKSITNGSTVADAAAYCAAKHGLTEYQHPFMAQRGDLVVFEVSGELIAGLVHLNGRHIVSTGPKGLHRLPITEVKCAWRVG